MPATARLSSSGAQQFVARYRTFLTDTTKEKGRRDERAVALKVWLSSLGKTVLKLAPLVPKL